ncbi:MAG: hypothetical protein ACLQGJ_08870, partial [Candidatus Dormibacteria bacterium]
MAVGNSGPSIAHSSAATPPPASAQQLLSGHWSVLPAAPIAARAGGSVVWTGSELLVWGGAEGDQDQERYRDGAAYSPSTGRWRLLPSAPLSARVDQATVWTGTEMIVWGGYDQESTEASQVTANGAAYDPSTNRWLMLPASPLSARAGSVAMWTGAEMVILGGQSGQTANSSSQSYGDGAAYDPAAGVWRSIPEPSAVEGHPVEWTAAVQTGGELIAWSEWQEMNRDSAGLLQPSGGVDLFAYDGDSGTWQAIPQARGALPDAQQVLWTGDEAVVRGMPYNCGACPGPPVADVTDAYQPATNSWTALAPDPVPDGTLTWTGAALLSFNPAQTGSLPPAMASLVPGDASVYNPAGSAWQMLPPAPSGCQSWPSPVPVWTGSQVLIYCIPYDAEASATGASGI